MWSNFHQHRPRFVEMRGCDRHTDRQTHILTFGLLGLLSQPKIVSVVGILSFASLVYICETELTPEIPLQYKNMTIYIKPNSTWTFPECFWWGLMTITTVGYDINPNVRSLLCRQTLKESFAFAHAFKVMSVLQAIANSSVLLQSFLF